MHLEYDRLSKVSQVTFPPQPRWITKRFPTLQPSSRTPGLNANQQGGTVGEELRNLIRRWREEADELRARYGDERTARLCEAHAQELEKALEGRLVAEPFDAEAIAAEIVMRIRRSGD